MCQPVPTSSARLPRLARVDCRVRVPEGLIAVRVPTTVMPRKRIELNLDLAPLRLFIFVDDIAVAVLHPQYGHRIQSSEAQPPF